MASVDPKAFDARYRWVILREMRPLGEFESLDAPELRRQLYAMVRDIIIDQIVKEGQDPLAQDLTRMKLLARPLVARLAAAEQAHSTGGR